MGEWVDQVHHKATLIHDQIATLQRIAPGAKVDFESAVVPYRKLLETLYLEELPYARLVDTSDLVIHAEGTATETVEPRISALTHLLDRLRDESRKLAKVVAGFTTDTRLDNVDLLLSGIAHGSLVVGLKVAPPAKNPKQETFIADDEPVFIAIRAAIRSLSELPRFISETGLSNEINIRIPEPALRDASLVALARLAPTGRSGISRIGISSPGHESGMLEPAERKILRDAIAHPYLSKPRRGTFVGEVREVDLDARRLEIRQVQNVGVIRCVYTELRAESARRWMGRRVRVQGQYESGRDGRPSLLKATRIILVREPKTKRLL